MQTTNRKTNVIFLHGWGQSPNMWNVNAGNFNKTQNYYYYLPGFDPKKHFDKVFTLKNYAEDLAKYINIKGLRDKKINFIAHSFSGRIVLKYLEIFHPKNIHSISFTGSNPFAFNFFKKAIFHIFYIYPPLFSYFSSNMLHPKKYSNSFFKDIRRTKILLDTYLIGHSEDLKLNILDSYPNTVFIQGQKDRIVSPNICKRISDTFPDIKTVQIQNAGHFPNIETPDLFWEIIRNTIM
jgi:pimeloyl-ACP methyl ester carboxylesterase